jgi:hypothetical protein
MNARCTILHTGKPKSMGNLVWFKSAAIITDNKFGGVKVQGHRKRNLRTARVLDSIAYRLLADAKERISNAQGELGIVARE